MSMSEKDMYVTSLEREVQTTIKVLRNYPSDKMEFTPHERSKKAKDLAWIFVGEQSLMQMAMDGEIKFGPMPPAPDSMNEIIAALEASTKQVADRVRNLSDADYNSSVKWFVGPGQMADVRKADVLWFVMMDHVHHRGQFSVYLRMAGGKVPSIYGPSADEPWM
ncbi:MAG: DinB family protein [Bacteroidota bacterium]